MILVGSVERHVVDVAIKKVGQRDGKDRFVLVNVKTRKVITVNDVSEGALRRFFHKRGTSDKLIDQCLQRSRHRYEKAAAASRSVDDGAATVEDNDLLFELGLVDESDEDAR